MELVGIVFLWIGVGFSAIGILGLVRLPDLYTRLHASGKVSTVGLCSLLLGAACLMPSASLKLLALTIFALLTLPVSTHAIAAAAYRSGLPLRRVVRDEMADRMEYTQASRLGKDRAA
jgi:multicomponent Na+:H+ antiporter subunit G